MSHRNIGLGIADQIINDLVTLVTDAKRKNPEIRHACEHSIEIIKPFSSSASQDLNTDIQSTVKSHPEFIAPWIMACLSKNSKLISQALRTLSKIIQLQLLPDIEENPKESVDVVEQIVDALYEASAGGEEIQVKLLQLLPSFSQLYAFVINDQILSKLLLICSNLQGANKSALIVNTAQATFTQLLDIAFGKVDASDAVPSEKKYEVPIDGQKTIMVDQYVYDVQRLLLDMCTLIEHHKPSFLQTNYISEDYSFEVLESLIKNNSGIFLNHVELAFLLRTKVAPLLLRFLSSSKDFTLMVKVSRLIFLLLNEEFDILRVESEVTLSLLTHIITKDSGSPNWKRIMALEIYASIFKNQNLLKKIFMEYDDNPTEERKRVINDFLTLCKNLVNEQKHILNTGDLIQPPMLVQDAAQTNSKSKHQQRQAHPVGLKSSDFDATIRYIDCIDKQEPPHIPETYNLFLISSIIFSLSDCIQSSTLDLMKFTDPILRLNPEIIESKNDAVLKKQYECVSDFIDNTWELQLAMADIFIRSTLDNEMFSSNLKLLENLCYCSGIVSLDNVKHSILKYLGISALKLEGTYGYKSRVQSISESIVGTISSTLGHAVSNISNNNTAVSSFPTNPVKFYSRSINTRQTLVFHTLVRLSVSLGSNLKSDWNIIFSVLQWVSYYIDGPTGFKSKDAPPFSQYLQNRDLQIIEHSLSELTKSIYNLDEASYSDMLKTMIELSDAVMSDSNETPSLISPFNKQEELQPCAFNRAFYIDKIADMCSINPVKFLILPESNMDNITAYFAKIVCDRSISDEMRILGSRGFNKILRACADTGFEDSDQNMEQLTELKVLINMSKFLEQLSNLPFSHELLIANCEAEIILQNLEALKAFIDRHGSHIQKMWYIVTDMLNIPFQLIEKNTSSETKEKGINEMITSILKSSFETLKVILDEVLHCIPKSQVKVIIDSLFNFVYQSFDMNISFNSVSYFWLISDYIKEKLELSGNSDDFFCLSLSEADLISVIDKSNEADNQYYQYLWIYLVLKLAKTIPDQRVQVRNGAIMTTFSVIESFSYNNKLLGLLYDIVLYPYLLQIKTPSNLKVMKTTDQKDWMDSYMNITTGIFKIFLNQINAQDFDLTQITKMSNGIETFMIELVNFDYNWTDLNTLLFKSYSEVINALLSCKHELSVELLERLYDPWESIKFNYSFNNASQYQTMLCSFISCFLGSFKLFQPIMTIKRFEKMLMIQNVCIRYPVLVDTKTDEFKCTVLQKLVLDNFDELEIDEADPLHCQYESLLIRQLNIIITLPFHTRDLIVKKIGDKGIKVPSFGAASYYGMMILKKHLPQFIDLTYVNDGSVLQVIKSLIEPSKLKNTAMKVKSDHSDNDKTTYLWMKSFELLSEIVDGVAKLILAVPDAEFENCIKTGVLDNLIPSFVSALDCCFVVRGVETDSFDLEQYSILKSALIKLFEAFYQTEKTYQISTDTMESFFSLIWFSSFFYQHDSIMASILPSAYTIKSMKEFANTLSNDANWDIYGTTERIIPAQRLQLSQQCLTDLTGFSNSNNFSSIGPVGLPFFIARCTYTFRKFLMDRKPVAEKPPTRVQIFELEMVVSCLQNTLDTLKKEDLPGGEFNAVVCLRSLVIQTLPLVSDLKLRPKIVKLCSDLCN